MRIGIDATFVGTSRPTGLGVYTLNIVNELSKIHGDIILWTSGDYGFKLDPSRVRSVLEHGKYFGDYLYLLRPFWMELCFPGHIRRENVDVLFSTVPGGMLFCPVPHVVTIHDLTPLKFTDDSPKSVQLNFRYRLGKILEQAAAIIAVSSATRDDICSFYNVAMDKVNVIGLGYDKERFTEVYAPDVLVKYGLMSKRYILSVGTDNPRKNLLRLVRSFGMIKNRSHLLVLVGLHGKEAKKRIMEVALNSGVSDRVMFLDYVRDEDLPIVYSGATLFCYPSLCEGFGLPVLEAMACGTPVVASKSSSIPEVAGQAAVLVDPENCQNIAAAIDEVIDDQVLQDILRKSGLERVKLFNWELAAQKTMSVLQSAMRN